MHSAHCALQGGTMLKNYLKIAFRNLLKFKAYSLINVTGLAIGFACCILLFLLVHEEWTYDTFHENADRIFQVYQTTRILETGELRKMRVTQPPLAPTLKEAFPEIEHAVRMTWGGGDVQLEGRKHRLSMKMVDTEFLDVFSFPVIYGNAHTALQDPKSVVLTKDKAIELFGVENAVGRTPSWTLGKKK
jgi:hypothetical protein